MTSIFDGQQPLALTDFQVQVAQLFFSLPEAAVSSWLVVPAWWRNT